MTRVYKISSILVVDDDEPTQIFMREILRDAGYRVHVASDGDEAIELFRRISVDLMVTDIVMPEKEGIETICEIKDQYPATKIIAISGTKFYLDFAVPLGADCTFEKPFDIEVFLSTVQTLLQSA